MVLQVRNNNVQTLAECNLTDALVTELCELNDKFAKKGFVGILGSVFVVHIGGSIGTLGAGLCDTVFQLAVAVVKIATGCFISPLNFFRGLIVSAKNTKSYSPNWGWTAAVTHLLHGGKNGLSIVPIFLTTLLWNPHDVRNTFFNYNVQREKREAAEAELARLKAEPDPALAKANAELAQANAELEEARKAAALNALPPPDPNQPTPNPKIRPQPATPNDKPGVKPGKKPAAGDNVGGGGHDLNELMNGVNNLKPVVHEPKPEPVKPEGLFGVLLDGLGKQRDVVNPTSNPGDDWDEEIPPAT